MKPRLCRASWIAFASTHPLMLAFTSPREALLLALPLLRGTCLPSLESTLSSPCSCSNHSLSCQGAALAHLDSFPPYNLVLWTDGSVPFPFDKGSSGVLVNYFLSVALRPLFPFQQTQHAQVFLLKRASFCKLIPGLGNTNKSATSLFPSDSCSVLATLFSSPSFLLPRSLWQELSSLTCSVRLQWVPGHSFLLRNDVAVSWPGREC